jgi:hypothetical protein
MDSTIKRVYDQYHLKDFEYGKVGSDNLNPQREMVKDQVALIEAAVQELTDEIVRKKIRIPKEVEDPIKAVVSGESPTSSSPERRARAKRAGSDTLAIFGDIPEDLELWIGTFPGSVNELSLPPIIACEEILRKYNFDTGEITEVASPNDGEMTYEISTSSSDDDDDDEDDNNNDDGNEDGEDNYSDQLAECAEIEMEWLKIILAILKIIKILNMILEKIIATVVLVIKIVCLAAGAWINPPNIAQIVEIIISLVMGLICMIIAKLIQLLFSLLNLDCLADQVMDVLDQIQEAMNAFSSTLGMLDPNTITFLGDLMKNGMSDLKSIVEELMQSKHEAWEQAKQEIAQTFSKENLKKIQDQMLKEAANAALNEANAQSGGKVTAIFNQASSVINEAQNISKETVDKFNAMQEAFTVAQNELLRGEKARTTDSSINKILSDPSIKGLSVG